MDNKALYAERAQRMEDLVNGKICDRVPIFSLIDNYAFNYAGISAADAGENWELMYQAYKKVTDDFKFDCAYSAATSKCMKYYKALGGGTYQFVNGIMEFNPTAMKCMTPDEYPQLIEDPYKFFAEKIVPRKFAFLREGTEEERVKKLAEATKISNDYKAFTTEARKRLEEECGMPVARDRSFIHPMCLIMDYLRNIDGLSIDMRRKKEELSEAIESLTTFVLDLVLVKKEHEIGKFVFNPLHTPPFISKAQFDKFYAPAFYKIINALKDNGDKMMCFFEKNYSHLYDSMKDIPKNTVIGLFEDDDMRVVKKELGDIITIAGGIKLMTLGYGTKQECLDEAKRAIDDLAPGGRYLFTTDKNPNTAHDIIPENMIAVNEFVREYGKY